MTFHFFSYHTALRFHISKRLQTLGWQKAALAHTALFSDRNLTLNDAVSKHLEQKDLLADLVNRYCPQIMPLTYTINDHNYEQVLAKITYDHYLIPKASDKAPKWILKPALLNNGDNIKLFDDIEALRQYYAKPQRLGGAHIIQQYLTCPHLLAGRKYTFRITAILTNYAGVFLCRQGYVNMSNFAFVDGFDNKKVHITNYVLDGEFANIEQRATQTLPNFEAIYPQIVAIVRAVIKGLLKKAPFYLKRQKVSAFELFGFDFMLDKAGKVWLLEVNQSPDAPTFEKNSLDTILWQPFWQHIVEDFVLPIAYKREPKDNYAYFTHLMTAKQSYAVCQHAWHGLLGLFHKT